MSADFSEITFSKNSSRNTIRVSNSLDPDLDRQNVGLDDPDLDQNVCKDYQQTTKVVTGKKGVSLEMTSDGSDQPMQPPGSREPSSICAKNLFSNSQT